MSEKRRDSKGRILRDGEVQRSDGRYMYRYTDGCGLRRAIYSWRLVETDKAPDGKRSLKPLREMEKEIQRDLLDGIDCFSAARTTLNDLYDKYVGGKRELKQTTRAGYGYLYEKHVRGGLGKKNIASIKYSNVKSFYGCLIRDTGLKISSVTTLNAILHSVFKSAVRDGLIRGNPTDGVIAEIKKEHGWEAPKRHALTEPQQERFVSFISASRYYEYWRPLLIVLLGTGGRIGEILALRWEDCDFENNLINIRHTLIYCQQKDSGMGFHIGTPKTEAGKRIIPMLSAVREALLCERARQEEHGFSQCEVDGYSGFIFSSRRGRMIQASSFNRVIKRIVQDCNAEECEAARRDGRTPVLLPEFSAHILRHTFCTRFCENETNIKVVQEIMGHRDIATTMDVYNEATREKKVASLAALDDKICLGES